MNEIQQMLIKKSNELAKRHSDIIENECKNAVEKYNVNPSQLIIEYHNQTNIKICIQVSEFEIVNHFTYRDGNIKDAIS